MTPGTLANPNGAQQREVQVVQKVVQELAGLMQFWIRQAL